MLRTNSKKAQANIRYYIINNYDGSSYDYAPTEDFREIALNIFDAFMFESHSKHSSYSGTLYERFESWCRGLPTILDTCYYYNRSAIKDLGDILEETLEEREKFTEDQAESLLTRLIFREIYKEV